MNRHRYEHWSTDPPTEPGLYWFKLIDSDSLLRFCRVLRNIDGKLVLGSRNYDEEKFISLDDLHRVWAGPLREPEQPDKKVVSSRVKHHVG